MFIPAIHHQNQLESVNKEISNLVDETKVDTVVPKEKKNWGLQTLSALKLSGVTRQRTLGRTRNKK